MRFGADDTVYSIYCALYLYDERDALGRCTSTGRRRTCAFCGGTTARFKGEQGAGRVPGLPPTDGLPPNRSYSISR